MDENISSAILQSNARSSSNYSLFSSSSDSASEKGYGITYWILGAILIVIVLTMFGFNVFAYLAKVTDAVSESLSPILKPLFGGSLYVGSQIVDVSAEGAKEVIQKTADVADSTLTSVQDVTPNKPLQGEPFTKPKEDVIQTAPVNQALNKRQQTQQDSHYDYTADSAESEIQGGGKSGWCYIGLDRGFRSCAEVGATDTCMSGDIFPSHEICINPSLRR